MDNLITLRVPSEAHPRETRRVYCTWGFGRPGWYELPVARATFRARRGGGWMWLVGECPHCGGQHCHASNLDALWDGGIDDPRRMLGGPTKSHCTDRFALYTLEADDASLPREARGRGQR